MHTFFLSLITQMINIQCTFLHFISFDYPIVRSCFIVWLYLDVFIPSPLLANVKVRVLLQIIVCLFKHI